MFRYLIGACALFALGACTDTGGDPSEGGSLSESAPASDKSDFEPWASTQWDPANSDPELVLPMPCGGQLAFRRVPTPTGGNWLYDVPSRFGNPNSDFGYLDSIWYDNLVGGFTGSGPTDRYYYIGVYEVTKRQWRAVMEADCADEFAGSATPAEAMTWFDAIEFTHVYNRWLLDHHSDLLTSIDGVSDAFVRLPTESEWEFATRGGLAVSSEEERRGVTFPMDAESSLDQYVHYFGSDSCNGEVQQIGTVKPNPLGLYDTLGNVREIVLDPFQPNSKGRLHGQIGGFLARGGSCQIYPEDIASALREELPVLDADEQNFVVSNFTGMRLVLGAVVQPNLSRLNALADDFESLGRFENSDNLRTDLSTVIDDIDDTRIRQSVLDLALGYEAEIAKREQMEARAVRSSVLALAVMMRNYRAQSDIMRRGVDSCPVRDQHPEFEMSCRNYEAMLEVRALSRGVYGDLVIRLSEENAVELIVEQIELARDALKETTNGDDYLDLVQCHVDDYRETGRSSLDRYFEQIDTLDLTGC